MKKLLGLLLLCASVLFFSCKTTDNASQLEDLVDEQQQETENIDQNSAEETLQDEESNAEQTTEGAVVEDTTPDVKIGWIDPEEKNETEVQEEKIPQEELDEMEVRLAEDKEELPIQEENSNEEIVEATPTIKVETEIKSAEQENKEQENKEPTVTIVEKNEPIVQPEIVTPPPVQSETVPPLVQSEPDVSPTKSETVEKPVQTPVVPSTDIALEYTFVDESLDDNPEEEFVGKEDEPIVPSRTLTVYRNQYVDIMYPGTGWIYLGEESNKNHFVFHGRKFGNGETMFTLRSIKSGSTVLHFYKNDALTGNYIDDYIEINVSEESAFDNVHVVAPSYADVVPPKYVRPTEDELAEREEKNKPLVQRKEDKPKELQEKNAKPQESEKTALNTPSSSTLPKQEETPSAPTTSEKVQTVIQTSESTSADETKKTVVAGTENSVNENQSGISENPANENVEQLGGNFGDILERAQKAYDEKRYADALNLIDQFFEIATARIDEGLYLEGRILESKSEVQNIKRAIEAYDALIKNWPQSIYWKRANERSVYLKRFYIDIR